MKKIVLATIASALTLLASTAAMATPSTQIWIPSTDIQGFGTAHLGIDNYVRTTSKNGGLNTYDLGLTFGVLPWEKVQAEVGIDYMESGSNVGTDQHPIYFNAKIGTPEDSLFKYSPAIAIGIYNAGTQTSGSAKTAQNISYGLLARTLPVVGRISAGGYHAAQSSVAFSVDPVTGSELVNNGALLSWDRTLSEITDKLWVGVDYMSGNNANGSLNFGVSWAFTKNVSVILGYDIYNNVNTGGKNTFNTQLDINFP
jgi:hypothetical protein